jgi:GTP-binding protein
MKQPIVALVGRPNVGKSTLFNRIAGQRLSIVEDLPGTTRDRLYARAEWTSRPFILVDTGGIDIAATETSRERWKDEDDLGIASRDYAREIRRQAEIAMDEADVVVLLVDARDGVTTADRDIADVLRRSDRPVVVAANKADNAERRLAALEFFELGLSEPFAISALHGTGTGDLLDAIVDHLPETREEAETEATKLAIVGRPNVGKSSLLNALLREERAIVSPIAGTTRDAIDTSLRWEGQDIVLIDTAGIRRAGKIEPGIEKYSVLRALGSIQRADVVLLVVDAQDGITAQDAHVAGFILEEMKSVVVVVNKWDAIPDKDSNTMVTYTTMLRERLQFLDYVPILFISALTLQRVAKVLPTAMMVAAQRRLRISTSELNRLIGDAITAHPAPSRKGKPLKFYYATQAESAPPTFVLFVNDADLVHFSYERFLENRIRSLYPFVGTPIRLQFRNRRQSSDR